MLWVGGASDTYNGKRFKGTLGDFVERVLLPRAKVVAEKRCGWVVTPTSNTDGHRVNTSTTAVHAFNFDCDGRGDWDQLLAILRDLEIAHIAYQSGGWSLTTPKWHVLLPLASPSDTSSPDKIDAHKRAYNCARVVLGALAGLPGEGFDPTVETPCVPVFITERRRQEDPPRQIVWRSGAALDLFALLAALPEVPRDLDPRAERVIDEEAEPLADDRLEEIVKTLCEPMLKILSGRRDLYLCLVGALLDRGLAAADVRAIAEEVSLRCPGDPRYTQREVEERHRQHLHDTETTISKREAGGEHTRIGTLVERWPDVARAIDAVLPNPEWAESVAWLEKTRAPATYQVAIPLQPARPAPVDMTELRAEVRRIRDRKLSDDDLSQKIRGFILKAVLVGDDPVPRMGGNPVATPSGEPYDTKSATEAAVWAIVLSARDASVLSFDALIELLRFSIKAAGGDATALRSVVATSFARAVDRRRRNEEGCAAEEAERRRLLQKRWGVW